MTREVLRRARFDDKVKQQIRDRVKQLLIERGQSDSDEEQAENSDGSVYLFDASDHSRSVIAIEFNTRKEFEQYKKDHDLDPRTKVKILDEGKGKGKKQEEVGGPRKPGKEEKSGPRKPGKEDEKGKAPSKKDDDQQKDKKQEKPDGDKSLVEKDDVGKDKAEGKKEERQPGELLDHSHPARMPEGIHRQVAIKDSLIEEFGSEAKDWRVHRIAPAQLTKSVVIHFPDGSEKKYGELEPDEKARVDRAVSEGLAASKGMADYTSVTTSAFQYNMASNLGRYDDRSVDETKNDSTEEVTRENSGKFASSLRENGRTLLRKYSRVMTRISRPMAEKFVDDLSDAVSEGVRDGSISGVSQADLDEFVREDIKRIIHQEVETRRRSLGDHGIRHVVGDINSAMTMLGELQGGGVKVTGKQKLMALSALANHDIGYTVGDAATEAAKGKKHKEYSRDLVEQEKDRYNKIFGNEDGDRVRAIIATHDDPVFDWEKDPVGSSVRLADNTSLFGEEKVQDLFLRSNRATELACRLRLAAEAKPDDKKLQDDIKAQMHEVIDSDEFEEADRESLHSQVDEMTEGKFSATTDILSRFSGKLQGFKYDSDKKMMNVNMKYSAEGQMVDQLFGDEVACRQFDKFTKDLGGQPVRGKRGNTIFKSQDGRPVFQLNIDGFDDQEAPSSAAMRDFQSRTARTELRKASMLMYPPPDATEKDIEKAKKVAEEAKEKFSEAEWKMLMEAFDEGKGDPVALAKKLGMWPLLQSEMDFLKSKTASSRIVRRLVIAALSDRIARDFVEASEKRKSDETLQESIVVVSSRGQQTQRKDKDLMSDTGGVSKNRQRDPEMKPPRSDSSNRYRTKDKTPEERDPDVDRKASVHPLDAQENCMFGMIPENNYYRRVWARLVAIISEAQGVSEKDFLAQDEIHKTADILIRSEKGEEMISVFQGVQARPEMCAEGLYFEMFTKAGKTASSGFESVAKAELSRSPRTFKEAVYRG